MVQWYNVKPEYVDVWEKKGLETTITLDGLRSIAYTVFDVTEEELMEQVEEGDVTPTYTVRKDTGVSKLDVGLERKEAEERACVYFAQGYEVDVVDDDTQEIILYLSRQEEES